MRRRTLLQLAAAGLAWARVPFDSLLAAPTLGPADEARLATLAEVVLPGELGSAGRREVVDGFLRWVRGYREGAEMDHGYGFTRLRRTPPSPVSKYPAQLAALDRAARAKGAEFAALDPAARREIVERALEAARVERLPVRPGGDHVAADLMAFYFWSPAANDLAYRAPIGRDQCRGLPGSEASPATGQTGVGPGSESLYEATQGRG